MPPDPPSDGPDHAAPAEQAADGDSSAAFEALLREAARQSSVGGLPALSVGKRLDGGRLQILRRIGQGGMGVVYEAFDAGRAEKVALKTMSRLEAGDVYRLKNEFRALADVSHPNLVSLHELCAHEGLWCFTMELVEGERFDRWVRPRANAAAPRGTLDEPRLRAALRQLVEAVAAIHAAGKLHRDLKPSNVLVTAEGRVVVLDFGLAIAPDVGGVGQTLSDDNLSGTPAYMAPEQAGGQATSSPSDYYAIGVMLFEALTGKLPFDGRAAEILVDKQRVEAPRASNLVPDVPPDLDALCARLLARDASVRPDVSALRALLPPAESDKAARSSQGGSTWSGRGSSHASEAAPALLGRDDELRALSEAFEASAQGQAVVLFVSGESGMGKSALCEAFLHELRAQGRATVLSGRCYERENVPFKGFDALVDDLSRHLRKLPREEAIALLPREVHALARLFPVLGRVEVVAAAPRRDVPDPLELRRRAYAALGELLGRMRDRGPLCLHLDDVQWLDADAVLFMRALLVHPEPTPALLLLSHRSENAEQNQALFSVRDAIEGNGRLALRTLEVEPLSQRAAHDLARRLLPDEVGEPEAAASAVARESGGSPFFVGELCRFVGRHGSEPSALARLSLQAALADHLSTLSPAARRLLEHSALAGKPLPAQLLLQAAHAPGADLDRLRAARLVRVSRFEGDAILECYHDKVRETVADALSELQRVGYYAALAVALEASSHPDPELLASCFEGAGQRTAAAEHWARAADQALSGAAFLHAAELYARALALGGFAPERAHALRVTQAEALAHAGRGKRAAALFLRAAEDVRGNDKHELRRRAAEELFNTGHAEEGMALFRSLFKELGLTLASSSASALPGLLYSQLRLRLRGLDYVLRDAGECAPRDRQKLALLASATNGLALNASPVIFAGVANEHALRALALGVPAEVALAFAAMAYNLSFAQPSAVARVTELSDTAVRIASELGDAGLLGHMHTAKGNAYINCGLWTRGREHDARALEILRSAPNAAQWVIDSAQFYDQTAAWLCGDWLHVANVTPGLIEQGYSRERLWIAVVLSSVSGPAAWLCGDDAAGYQRTLERAKSRWFAGKEALWPDLFLALAQAALHLYRSEAEQAHATMERSWGWLSRSLVTRAELGACLLLHFRGVAALAVFRRTGATAALSALSDCAKRLSRLTLPYAVAHRALLDAGLWLHARDVERAAQQLRAAAQGFEDNDMLMWAAATRRRLGALIGGDEGAALIAQGDAVMRAQRVVDLDAVSELLCAGLRAP